MREFETNDERIHDLPSCINSSVARKKTLIPVKSESILHSATNPKDASYFRDLCKYGFHNTTNSQSNQKYVLQGKNYLIALYCRYLTLL